MKSIVKVSLLSIVILILGIGCASTEANKTHNSKHWSYEGDSSEMYWSSLSEDYKLCKEGKLQSPINIVPTKDIDLDDLDLNYKSSSKSIVNNGHTIQVNINDGSFLELDFNEYELKQFHFHTPSEHNLYGKQYPLEAHFVHVTEHGRIAVVAVIFKIGKKNKILEKIWDNFPLKVKEEIPFSLSSKDIKALMPKYYKQYYKFEGSLTTPPCTEGVKWNVYKKALTLSEDQINQFFEVFGHANNREIQKTNNRKILK